MTFNTEITLELPDAKTARWFADSLQDPHTAAQSNEEEIDEEASARATVSIQAKTTTVHATVTGKDFASLRARTTTLLRDCKVVFDVLNATGKTARVAKPKVS